MTLDEARDLIGALVVYRESGWAPAEQGVVTSVNDSYVFVRYGADTGSMATSAEKLEPLVRG